MKQLTTADDCKKCAEPCCRFHADMPEFTPLFTKDEVGFFRSKGIDENNFYSEDDRHYWLVFKEKEGKFNLCPFVSNNVLCSIYEHRPLGCRMWPFAVIRKDNGVYLAIDARETCEPVTRKRNSNEYKMHAGYLGKYLESREAIKLLLEYPKLIVDDHPDYEPIKRLDKLSSLFS